MLIRLIGFQTIAPTQKFAAPFHFEPLVRGHQTFNSEMERKKFAITRRGDCQFETADPGKFSINYPLTASETQATHRYMMRCAIRLADKIKLLTKRFADVHEELEGPDDKSLWIESSLFPREERSMLENQLPKSHVFTLSVHDVMPVTRQDPFMNAIDSLQVPQAEESNEQVSFNTRTSRGSKYRTMYSLLTPKQIELLQVMEQNPKMNQEQLGKLLNRSSGTVSQHLITIKHTLGVKKPNEAVEKAIELGLIRPTH
jgi:DNA-binding CsgD family transcriptional regulator